MKIFRGISLFALVMFLSSLAFGAVSRINDVNLTSYTTQNVVGVFTNYTLKTFPIEESYGANNFWTKWDIIRNADHTVSFTVGGYYIVASNGQVGTSTTLTDEARFHLEEKGDTYYIRAAGGQYLSCKGEGFKAIGLDDLRSDDTRWYFFQPQDPTDGNLNDLNLYNHEIQNIIGIFTNYIPKAFPYEQTYGPFTFWSRFDLTQNVDGQIQFKVGGYHLTPNGDILGTASSGSYYWTLESSGGAWYIKDLDGRYLTTTGTGFKNMSLADAASDEALWYFMNPIAAVTDLGLPHAVTADEQIGTLVDVAVDLDGSASSDSDSNTPLSAYAWELVDAPADSLAVISGADAAQAVLTPDVAGTYVVALTVTDADGLSNTTHQHIYALEDVQYEVSSTLVDENTSTYAFNDFQSSPVVFANMQSFNGSDPAGVRIMNTHTAGFSALIEEETSNDSEIGHNNEVLGFVALAEGDLYDESGEIIGEAGSFSHTQSDTGFSTLSFANTYTNPVVVLMMNTYNGTNPAHMRLNNVNAGSVAYKIEEWSYLDGTHGEETIAYLVVEAGTHTLYNGALLQAQKVTTDEQWVDLDFATAYTNNPVVLSMSQTQSGGDPVVTRHNNITTASMSVRLQEEEGKDGTHNNETVGVISIGN